MSVRVLAALAVALVVGAAACGSDAVSTSSATTVRVSNTERLVNESRNSQPGTATITAASTAASTAPATTPTTRAEFDEEDPLASAVQPERVPTTAPPSLASGGEPETSTTQHESATTTTPTTAPPPTTSLSLSVEIHQPAPDTAVTVEDQGTINTVMTQGTSTGVTGSLGVVLLIHPVDPAGGDWFPMSPFSVDAQGRWEGIAFVGGHVGDRFEMIAVITDQRVSEEIGHPNELEPVAASATVPFTVGDIVQP